jgi:hypothetical protein
MRRRRALILAATVVLLALVGGAIGGLVWLKHYTPLTIGAGYGPDPSARAAAIVRPTFGKWQVFPRPATSRDYFVGFDLTNDGPLDVTVLGLDTHRTDPDAPLLANELRVRPGAPGVATRRRMVPAKRIRIPSRGVRYVYVGFRTAPCGDRANRFVTADRVWLRFRYARFFTRTEAVEMPLTVKLSCDGVYPPST